MNKLTLPGEIKGLLRRGSPVIYDGHTKMILVDIQDIEQGDAVLWEALCADCEDGDGGCHWYPLADIDLDLSDPTGRVHAVWWLTEAGTVELEGWVKIGGTSNLYGSDIDERTIVALRNEVLRVVGFDEIDMK